jgi:hypothetical protein
MTGYKCELIDNAPAVVNENLTTERPQVVGNSDRLPMPQGECKTCTHRDPEDKKCDCGALERQGCPFPVSDDYFCKFYERCDEE